MTSGSQPSGKKPGDRQLVSRRAFVSALGLSALQLSGCKLTTHVDLGDRTGRLFARPKPPSQPVGPGMYQIGLPSESRDGLLYVPVNNVPDVPSRLLVLLHGAGGQASNWFGSYQARADAANCVLLVPDSRFVTWDRAEGEFAHDLEFIDAALASAFDRCLIDRSRMAIAGFSDGASYALSLGLINGDLFRHVMAYSPGFLIEDNPHGDPGFFVAHGNNDQVLSVQTTRSYILPTLRRRGHRVEYLEFAGNHSVPAAVASQSMAWLTEEWGKRVFPPPRASG